MNKFTWLFKDYQNESLNNLAKRTAEFHTAMLINDGVDVDYTTNGHGTEIGKLLVNTPYDYTVLDTYIINDIFNLNVYFTQNTEMNIQIDQDHYGTFDCLVSLAAGNKIETNPEAVGLKNGHHYVIDISPTAIHKSMGLYKNISEYTQLDIFNLDAVTEFLSKCQGSKGYFIVSNCFAYYPSSLIYDVKLRLEMQNKFINLLANDKIDWYVDMVSADGISYSCARARDITNKVIDERFKVLPWIQ